MLALDSLLSAKWVARRMGDPQVQHFYDPQNLTGRAVAESLGHPGKVAWDIYLFYDPRAQWGDGLPLPACWAHQLTSAPWIDPRRYHERDLVDELGRMARWMTGLQNPLS